MPNSQQSIAVSEKILTVGECIHTLQTLARFMATGEQRYNTDNYHSGAENLRATPLCKTILIHLTTTELLRVAAFMHAALQPYYGFSIVETVRDVVKSTIARKL